MSTIRLTAPELIELTDYKVPARQLEVLHARGFWRACIGRDGRVLLERAHYEAVCAGQASAPERKPRPRPINPQRRAGVQREAEPRAT